MMLFLLGKAVEEKVVKQLKNKHAVAIYNRLTCGGTNYITVYVLYIRNEEGSIERSEINLLECAPMPSVGAEVELIENLGLVCMQRQC